MMPCNVRTQSRELVVIPARPPPATRGRTTRDYAWRTDDDQDDLPPPIKPHRHDDVGRIVDIIV
jgi:hypothetical protein